MLSGVPRRPALLHTRIAGALLQLLLLLLQGTLLGFLRLAHRVVLLGLLLRLHLLLRAQGLLLLQLLHLLGLLLLRLHLLLCPQGLLLLQLLHLLSLLLRLHLLLCPQGLLLLHLLGLCLGSGTLLHLLLLACGLQLHLLLCLCLCLCLRGALLLLLAQPVALLHLLKLLRLLELLRLLRLLQLLGLLEALCLLRLKLLLRLRLCCALLELLLRLLCLGLLPCLLELELLLLSCLKSRRRQRSGGAPEAAEVAIAARRDRCRRCDLHVRDAVLGHAQEVAPGDGAAAEDIHWHQRERTGRVAVQVLSARQLLLVGDRAIDLVDVALAGAVARPPGSPGASGNQPTPLRPPPMLAPPTKPTSAGA